MSAGQMTTLLRSDANYVKNAGKALRNEASKGLNATSSALKAKLEGLGRSGQPVPKKNILLTLASRLTSDPRLSGSQKAKELFSELLQLTDYKNAYQVEMDGHEKELVAKALPKQSDGSARVEPADEEYLVPGRQVVFKPVDPNGMSTRDLSLRPHESKIFDSTMGPQIKYKMPTNIGLANTEVFCKYDRGNKLVTVVKDVKIGSKEFHDKMGQLNRENALVMNDEDGNPKAIVFIDNDNKVKFVPIKEDNGFVEVLRGGINIPEQTTPLSVTIDDYGHLTITRKSETGQFVTNTMSSDSTTSTELAHALLGRNQSSRA